MHDILVSDGIVLRKRPLGEAHSGVWVLTREFGLVRAKATSARSEKSKLRYGLEPLTRGRFSFVKGRSEWRLIGVEQVSRAFASAPLSARTRIGQVSRLLMRLLRGQEPNPELFGAVLDGFDVLSKVEQDADPSRLGGRDEADAVECVLVLRILARLGYLPELPAVAPFVESGAYSPGLAAQALSSRRLLIKLINESLQASGL